MFGTMLCSGPCYVRGHVITFGAMLCSGLSAVFGAMLCSGLHVRACVLGLTQCVAGRPLPAETPSGASQRRRCACGAPPGAWALGRRLAFLREAKGSDASASYRDSAEFGPLAPPRPRHVVSRTCERSRFRSGHGGSLSLGCCVSGVIELACVQGRTRLGVRQFDAPTLQQIYVACPAGGS